MGGLCVDESVDNFQRKPITYLDKTSHHKVLEKMESFGNSGGYTDILRPVSPMNKSNTDYSRTSIDYNMNMNAFAVPPIDFDPFIPFPSCTPSFKDFVFKEKSSHDIADALLSLKHAVVHPNMGSLGSPLAHLGSPMGSPNNGSQGPFQSSCGSQSQFHQYPDPHSNCGQNQNGGLFPAMSVNVSMSMNVGMPTAGPYNPLQPQWNTNQQSGSHPQQFTTTQTGPGQYSAHYSAHDPTYNASYSFTHDVKYMGPQERDSSFHRPSENFSRHNSKFYDPPRRSSRIIPERHDPISSDSMKVNLCRMCGKTYARPSTLKTHMRTHSGEKPYRCPTCNKSFSQAANLTAHVRTHSGEKPFVCPICDRRFSQSSSVTTHMRTHSGERPYRCRLCKKAFSDSSTLTKHLRIHSGEKPYQCKLCLLRFSQSGNLNRHMRVHSTNGT